MTIRHRLLMKEGATVLADLVPGVAVGFKKTNRIVRKKHFRETLDEACKGGVSGFIKKVAKGAGTEKNPKYALGVWMAEKKYGQKKVSKALKRMR